MTNTSIIIHVTQMRSDLTYSISPVCSLLSIENPYTSDMRNVLGLNGRRPLDVMF